MARGFASRNPFSSVTTLINPMERLKFIWPVAILVLGVFALVIGIFLGLLDPELFMI